MSPPSLLALQCAGMLAGAWLAGRLAQRLGQPAVVGQLGVGFALAPLAGSMLFPAASLPRLADASRVLLWLFLFDAGLETPSGPLRKLARQAAFISTAGIVVPFALGAGLGLASAPALAATLGRPSLFALFMGTALSITAVPVIASILRELRLLSSELGALVMSAAVIDDAVGWTLLAVCAALAGTGTGPKWWTAVSSAGPFLAGLAAGSSARLRSALTPVSRAGRLLSPIFFAWAGLGASWGAFSRPAWPALFLLAACAGKLGGCWAGSRAAGLYARSSAAVAAAMNARGAMGLAAAAIGRSLGILAPEAYTMVLVVAAATTVMTPPLLRRWAGDGYLRFSDKSGATS